MNLLEAARRHVKFVEGGFGLSQLLSHNPTKGDVREGIVSDFLRKLLPACYGLGTGQVFSRDGRLSRQMDVVIYDTMYSLVFQQAREKLLIPCESVYGTVEIKTSLRTRDLQDAIQNSKSLHALKREASDMRDLTPVNHLPIGDGLSYDRTVRNPYFCVVFANDGNTSESIMKALVKFPADQRSMLPDFIFNWKRQYIVSKATRNLETGMWEFCKREAEYGGFLSIDLEDNVLPMFYLTLNIILNDTRLKQPPLQQIWNTTIEQYAKNFSAREWA